MPRLLIVNCTHDSLLQSLAALGSRPYDTQFVDSVSRHGWFAVNKPFMPRVIDTMRV